MTSNKVNLIFDSVFSSFADAIVIPCSTAGTVTSVVKREFESTFNIPFPKLDRKPLGTIKITNYNLPTNRSNNLKPAFDIIYAVSVEENTSSYNAIQTIIEEIGEFTKRNPNVRDIATTLLGTGAGGLNHIQVYKIIKEQFIKYSREDCFLYIFILDEIVFNDLIKSERSTATDPVVEEFNSLNESARKKEFLNYLTTYPCYLVGALWGNTNDQSSRFFKEGIWENGREDRYAKLVKDIQVGSVLFLKSTFATGSKSYLRIKGAGIVVSNPGDGIVLHVNWKVKNVQYDVGDRGSYRSTVAKVNDQAIKEILGALADWELFKNELFGSEENWQTPLSEIIDPDSESEIKKETPRRSIESTFLSDYHADKDLLNYELYASAIVAFINHKNTRPPLTIGIMAPWGKGKTSLMRFIQRKLQLITPKISDELTNQREETSKTATFSLFRKWIDQAKEKFSYEKSLRYPTVWFNAWKFQKNEQIWAGFAHEIIHQLVNQLPNSLAKEEFWLRLNLKRIDQEKLKNNLRLKIISKMLKALIGFGVSLGALILSLILHFPISLSLLTCIPFFGLSTFLFFKSKTKVDHERIDFDISRYIKQPDYSNKRGFFQEVEEDLKDVMNLLVSDDYSAVIFIDDLDRCSPNIVAEVVEAVNLFISGDFPKCYFILGQDAQMVAASLDVAYDKVNDKSSNVYREQGSLGWHFMEKFIQLQFSIPVINDDLSKAFFKSFFNAREGFAGARQKVQIEKQINAISDRIEQAKTIDDLLSPDLLQLEEELKLEDPILAAKMQERIIERAATEYDDNDPEVFDLIENLSEHVGSSPRSIKRFINLYRFYKFLQFTNRNSKLQQVSSIQIGQWIVFMIRWPQLVRAIQWNTESEFIRGDSALKRAKNFENLISRYSIYSEWEEFIVGTNNKSIAWSKDFDLFNFIKICKKTGNKLENAVSMGIW